MLRPERVAVQIHVTAWPLQLRACQVQKGIVDAMPIVEATAKELAPIGKQALDIVGPVVVKGAVRRQLRSDGDPRKKRAPLDELDC